MAAAVRDVVVERDGDVLVVRWEGDGQDGDLEIGIGPTPEAAGHDRALTVSAAQRSARIEGFGAGRYYVSVSSPGAGAAVSAERRVPFASALGLHAVYDLRGEAERDRYPNPFLGGPGCSRPRSRNCASC